MSQKTMKILVLVLAIFTIMNIFAICFVDQIIAASMSDFKTVVLGTAFGHESADDNTIDINLIRPPMTVTNPGTTVAQNFEIKDFKTNSYVRAIFKIIIEDGNKQIVSDFQEAVEIEMNDGWIFRDGYWYYSDVIPSDSSIQSPIKSIYYSDSFADHMDYKVYIPMIIECVESNDLQIGQIDCWPNNDIDNVDYKRFNETDSWVTTTTFRII